MAKNLKYFMRKEEDVETVVTVPGPETIKDDEGNVIQLEVKVLSAEHIRRINDNYHTRTIALDKKGNPYINAGNVVFRDERDNAKATATSSAMHWFTRTCVTGADEVLQLRGHHRDAGKGIQPGRRICRSYPYRHGSAGAGRPALRGGGKGGQR